MWYYIRILVRTDSLRTHNYIGKHQNDSNQEGVSYVLLPLGSLQNALLFRLLLKSTVARITLCDYEFLAGFSRTMKNIIYITRVRTHCALSLLLPRACMHVYINMTRAAIWYEYSGECVHNLCI